MFIQSFPRVYQSATFQASRLPSICTFETVENFNNSLTPSWRCTRPGVLQKIKKCLPSECNVSSIFEASPLIKSVTRVLRSVPTRCLSICYEGYAYNLRKVNMFIHCGTEASLLSFTRVMPLLIIHCAMFLRSCFFRVKKTCLDSHTGNAFTSKDAVATVLARFLAALAPIEWHSILSYFSDFQGFRINFYNVYATVSLEETSRRRNVRSSSIGRAS